MAEAKTKKKPSEKEMSFEEALARLEELVKQLESGTAPLEESLSSFEEGVALVKRCTAQLDAAEKKIKVLTRDSNGDITEADFSPAES